MRVGLDFIFQFQRYHLSLVSEGEAGIYWLDSAQALPRQLRDLIGQSPSEGISMQELRLRMQNAGARFENSVASEKQIIEVAGRAFLAGTAEVDDAVAMGQVEKLAIVPPPNTRKLSNLESLASDLVTFITRDNEVKIEARQIFRAWMMMNFNSLHLYTIFTTAGDDDFSQEFCSLVRQSLRERMQELVAQACATKVDEVSVLNHRYLVQHAIAAYAYFKPELEPFHELPRVDKDGKWQIIKHKLRTFEQGSSLIEKPALTYVFEPQVSTDDVGPLVLFRGTPPGISTGRCIARLDNFSPLGSGGLQWLYVKRSLVKYLSQTAGRLDVVGHSQGGSLALRLASYAAEYFASRAVVVDADSPAGEESFRQVCQSKHRIYVYAHQKDVVPFKSGAMPDMATVLLASAARMAARAHTHIGNENKIITGAEFNALARHTYFKQVIKRIASMPLFLLYSVALLGKSLRTLSEWPFRRLFEPSFESLSTEAKIVRCAVNVLLLPARIVSKMAIMVG